MKDKTKKIMAGVGIGLALTSSGLLMAGCTETPVTDAQVEKVFEALDNANEFLTNTSAQLSEQNQALIDIKNLLSEEDHDQIFENALKKYNYAMNKLHLNIDNMWDNLKITWNYDGSDGQRIMEMHYLKLENGINVFYSKDQENNVIVYSDTSEDDEKFNEMAYNACAGTMNGEYPSFTKDDIVEVKVLENGNYKMILTTREFMGQGDCEAIINVEITPETKIKEIDYYTIVKMGEYGYGLQYVTVNYEYGVLNESEVQDNIEAYQASQEA